MLKSYSLHTGRLRTTTVMLSSLVYLVSYLGFVLANSNIILFTSYFVSRDHARFCCNKYGMSLMKITSQAENDVVESFLRTLPGVSQMWIGVFQDPMSSSSDAFVWSDGETPSWLNWNNDTLDIISSNSTSNETLCIKAKLEEPSGMLWVISPCDDLLEYGCQVGLNTSVIPNTLTDAVCPKLVKLSGRDLNRTVTAHRYGYFDVDDQIQTMGTQVGSKLLHSVTHASTNCAIHCLETVQCAKAIIIADQLCIMYSAV